MGSPGLQGDLDCLVLWLLDTQVSLDAVEELRMGVGPPVGWIWPWAEGEMGELQLVPQGESPWLEAIGLSLGLNLAWWRPWLGAQRPSTGD